LEELNRVDSPSFKGITIQLNETFKNIKDTVTRLTGQGHTKESSLVQALEYYAPKLEMTKYFYKMRSEIYQEAGGNPNHDKGDGRFTTGGGGGKSSPKGSDPKKRTMGDMKKHGDLMDKFMDAGDDFDTAQKKADKALADGTTPSPAPKNKKQNDPFTPPKDQKTKLRKVGFR
jgi:hypothetical protein